MSPGIISYDERVLLNSCDEDIAVVSESDGADVEGQLDEALARRRPVIAVKHLGLARDLRFWLKSGLCCRLATVLAAAAAGACSALDAVGLSRLLAVSSGLAGLLYCVAWHWDPIFSKYHLLRDPRLLVFLGGRCRRGTSVVLIRNERRWTGVLLPVLAPALAGAVAFRAPSSD